MRKRFTFILCLLALSAAVSCSFFEPRDPAYPDPDAVIPWQQPYSPATVVINLENAMEGRSVAMTMACCDSAYMFIANGADTTEFSAWNFSNWDYDVEQNTMMNVFNAAQASLLPEDSLFSVTMNTSSTLPADPVYPADSADIWRDYEIIVAGGGDYCGWENPAKGQVMFFMVEDDFGLWSIERWYDYRSNPHMPEFYTWGAAKVRYR